MDNPQRHKGIDGEGFDGTYRSSTDDPNYRVPNAYVPMDFAYAQSIAHTEDAHCVPYVAYDTNGNPHECHPRINVGEGLKWARNYGFNPKIQIIRLDLDFIDHKGTRWTPEMVATTEAQLSEWDRENLLTFGFSQSRGGFKFDQILTEPIYPEQYQEHVRGFVQYLRTLGVGIKDRDKTRAILSGLPPPPDPRVANLPFVLDLSKVTWNDHFRLHDVIRRGEKRRDNVYPLLDCRDKTPLWQPIPFPEQTPLLSRTARIKAAQREQELPRTVPEWSKTIPDDWKHRCQIVAQAIKSHVPRGTWNDMFLALSGALCMLGVDWALIPEIVWNISNIAGASPDKDRKTAERTIKKISDRQRSTGMKTLRRGWPHVALALGSIVKWKPREDTTPEQDREARKKTVQSMQDVFARLEDMQQAIICAETGLGKTHEAVEKAITRALQGLNTGLSVPTNDLAEKRLFLIMKERCDQLDIPLARLFGSLSVKPPDPRACIYHNRVKHLPQYVHHLFCLGQKDKKSGETKPCERHGNCPVEEGIETNQVFKNKTKEHGSIFIGNHTLLSRITNEIGQNGLLFIDEPPPVVETIVLTDEDRDAVRSCTVAFSRVYMDHMKEVLDATWLFPNLLDGSTAEKATDARTVFKNISGLEHALPPEWKGTEPPLSSERSRALRDFSSQRDGKIEGQASRGLQLLYEIAREANGALIELATAIEKIEEKTKDKKVISEQEKEILSKQKYEHLAFEGSIKEELFNTALQNEIIDEETRKILEKDTSEAWQLEQKLKENLLELAFQENTLDQDIRSKLIAGSVASSKLDDAQTHETEILALQSEARALYLETRDNFHRIKLNDLESENGLSITEEPNDFNFAKTPLHRKVTFSQVKKNGRTELHITRLHREFLKAIQRTLSKKGGNVILDANATTNVPLYEKAWNIKKEDLNFFHFIAQDGCPVQRVRVDTIASRKELMPDRKISSEIFSQKYLGIIKHHIDHTDEIYQCRLPRKFGLITFMALALAIREAGDYQYDKSKWNPKWGDLQECASHVKSVLPTEILQRLTVEWYGNIRGADHLKHTSIITIGDPRPDPESTWEIVEFLGLGQEAAQTLIDSIARDELDQAHGRGRTTLESNIPQFPLHIGQITPGGTGWSSDISEFAWGDDQGEGGGGDSRHESIVARNACEKISRAILIFTPNGQRKGGAAELSRATGIDRQTLLNWSSGVEPTIEGLEAVRAALANRGTEQVPSASAALADLETLVSKCGSIRLAADMLKKTHMSVSRWLSGERSIPSDVAIQLFKMNLHG